MSGTKELAAQLNAIASELGVKLAPPDGGGNGWTSHAQKTDSPYLGVSVPIKVETPAGSVKCFLSLPPEVASSPESLVGAIKQLMDMGIPVDVYQGQQGNGWGRNNSGGGWQRNGGYGGGGGGYNGGGNGYRRGW